MAQFKARKLKKGLFEVLGLEEFIEGKVAELKRALGAGAAPELAVKRSGRKKVAVKAAARSSASLDLLVAALAKHPRRAALVQAGKAKDQLLRSLVPLYVARALEIEVNSGLISRFWNLHGVTYAPPNAAKALRNHVGYARASKGGQKITPNGVKYVEAALASRAA